MSAEDDKDNSQNGQQTPTTQSLLSQNLNFSINDILSNNHDVNDSSFQSIVQTLSNNNNDEHITPSYAHLPAELQDLFNTNETDDLLSEQGGSADASILQGDLWNGSSIEPQLSHPFMPSPQQPSINIQASPSPTTSSTHQKSNTNSITSSPTALQTPILQTTPMLQHPTTLQQQQPTLQHPTSAQQSPASKESSPANKQPSPTTLLDNITSTLPPEKKDRFIQLFRQLQTNSISAADFLSQAKQLLGKQQYQQLEDLKNKPVKSNDAKRPLPSSQIRAEDAQRSMPGIIAPQIKRAKTEHIPIPQQQQPQQQQPQFQQPIQSLQQQQYYFQLQLQQQQQAQQQQQQLRLMQPQSPQKPLATPTNIGQPPPQPIFKAPAMPTPVTGLQVPSKANVPPSSKPPTSNTAGPAAAGGDSRIDYEQLTDVMGYAGVDLREETEHFMKDGDGVSGSLPDGIDRSRSQDFMNIDMLRDKILKHAKCVNIKDIDSDYVAYMALATQDRIRNVIEAMVHASKHRTHNPFKKPPMSEDGHPLYKIQVKQNVRFQLDAIERVDRHTELDLDPSDDEEQENTQEKGWYSKQSKKPLVVAKEPRKVTVQDAIFVMERDVQGGRGTNQRSLLRALNDYLS